MSEYDRLKAMKDEILSKQMSEEIRQLREERDKLVKALEWYADYDNYSERTAHNGHDVIADAGERALNVLSEIKGQGENVYD